MVGSISLILFLIFAVLLQIVVHEAGHLVFGLMTGYKFVSFTILNFRIYKRDKKLTVGLSPVIGAGGQAAMEPNFSESDNIPVFWYNAGGTVFNLLSSFLAGWFVLWLNDESFIRTFFVAIAIVGLFFAVSNGIPMRTHLQTNDAYNILMMINNPSAKRAFYRIMKINAFGMEERIILDYPAILFSDLPENDYNNPLICCFAIDKIFYFLELEEYQKALDICNEMLKAKNIPGIYKNEATCEKQFCEIMLGITSTNKPYFLKKSTTKARLVPLASYHTQYSYAAFISHDKDKAEKILNSFERDCKKSCNRGIITHERYIFNLLKQRSV